MIGSYRTVSVDARIIGGKLAYAKKGIAFFKLQLVSAASKFQTALSGSDYEDSLNIQDNEDDNDNWDGGDDSDHDDVEEEYEHYTANSDNDAVDTDTSTDDNFEVLGESITQNDLFVWKFPPEVSQSTLDGRNGSSACSVIALILAHGAWHQGLNLQPTLVLSPLWVKLLCAAIRVGNRLYDRCRLSLPQRFLSASEAATVVQPCVSVSVDSPLPVRVFDEHGPTTLLFQLRRLCARDHGDAALLIVNEKRVVFIPVGNSSIVLVDTHRHGLHGAELLLGHQSSLNQFVSVCQTVLDLQDDTYANLCFISI